MRGRRPWWEQLAVLVREIHDPGSSGVSGLELWRGGQVAVTTLVVVTNLVGVAAAVAAAYLVVPLPAVGAGVRVRSADAVLAAACAAVALPAGAVLGNRSVAGVRRWLVDGGPPGPGERREVLLAPLRLFALQVGLWCAAALVLGLRDARWGTVLGLTVAGTVVVSGLVTATCAYLLTERALRPAAARVLATAAPGRPAVPGVATRALLTWALSSGLLLLAILTVGVAALAGEAVTARRLAVAMVALGGTGLAVGLLSAVLSARATAEPIDAVTRALEQVEAGRLDTRVAVYDGTHIGALQRGFNGMVAGLQERERIRRAFGTYVDPAVAEWVLGDGIRPEGEVVEVTVMFVDVRGFTALAEREPAPEVLSSLNRLFARIVPVVHAHGGRVDKYVGDGLMAVFGAPRRQEDHAARAVRAAREIVAGAGAGLLPFGVGLNSGPVVAGNVGADGRLELGVIGDAVNVAARVEAATRRTGDTVLLTASTRAAAGLPDRWFVGRPPVHLEGRQDPVAVWTLAVARAPADAPADAPIGPPDRVP